MITFLVFIAGIAVGAIVFKTSSREKAKDLFKNAFKDGE